jgi:O-succinylbenzoic acid--CoA ligase
LTATVEPDRAWLSARAQRSPGAVALVIDERSVSWAELSSLCDRIAGGLAAGGATAGACIALLAAVDERFVATIHAIQRLGATAVPLSCGATDADIERMLATTRSTTIVCDNANVERAASFGRALTFEALLTETINVAARGTAIEIDAAHTILFTSGTAAAPKAVVLTNANHYPSALAACRRLDIVRSDRWLAAMPMNHVGGLSILLRSAIVGFSVVLRPRFDAVDFDTAVRENGVTVASMVGTMLARWLDVLDGRNVPASFRCALLGGAAISQELVRRAQASGIAVATTYGLTETASQVTTCRPGEAADRPGSSGFALDDTMIRIDSPDDDGYGEICVQGPQVMQGYLCEDRTASRALRDGWLHTGDLGRIGTDRYLYVRGRRDDMIITGGENVSPAEVEAALDSHPAVIESGVYGVEDPEWGQVVACAVVVAADRTVNRAELREHCRARLAAFKVPKRIVFVETLPRTPSGKLRRSALASF